MSLLAAIRCVPPDPTQTVKTDTISIQLLVWICQLKPSRGRFWPHLQGPHSAVPVGNAGLEARAVGVGSV